MRSHIGDLNPREWCAVIPLVVMMVWMGVYSQSFLPPVSKVNAHVLDQTRINVPFRVEIPRTEPRPPVPAGLNSCRSWQNPSPLRSTVFSALSAPSVISGFDFLLNLSASSSACSAPPRQASLLFGPGPRPLAPGPRPEVTHAR